MAMKAITYTEAAAEVRTRVNRARSSFHAGMAILPAKRRQAMYAVYAFCREVDDIADDSPNIQIASEGLALWRRRINELFRGAASESITMELLPAIRDYNLIEADFQAIIDGMEMDADIICAPDEKTFDLYCDRVASAVGRISVRIFGDASTPALQVAHHLGRALQTTNILRDLTEDAKRGRLYIPAEILNACGISERDPMIVAAHPKLPEASAVLGQHALQHFEEAQKAMKSCDASAMRPARIMCAYYWAILESLRARKFCISNDRFKLPVWRKAWIIFRYGFL